MLFLIKRGLLNLSKSYLFKLYLLWVFKLIGLNSNQLYTSNQNQLIISSDPRDDDAVDKSGLNSCTVHENCSYKIFSLDTYCCKANYCCSWFELMANFNSNPTVVYKAPSLLTIFTLLISIICLLFISYCFCILFCYYFKCGLFKVPKLVVLSTMPRSHNTHLDATTAEILSPKRSTGSSGSATTTSSSTNSSHSSSSSLQQNRTNISKLRSKYKNSSHRQTPTNGQRAKSKNRHRSPSNGGISHSVDNHNHKKRQITARVSSTGSAHRNRNRNLYAEADCYIDYDNDSPFLIPPHLANKNRSSSSSSQRRSGQTTNSNRSNRPTTSSSYRTSSSNLPSTSASVQRRLSLSQVDEIERQRPSGTAVALIDMDLRADNQLETVNAGGSLASSRASSIGFTASLLDTDNQLSSRSALPSAPSYYQDEKPPAYDDIIKSNN